MHVLFQHNVKSVFVRNLGFKTHVQLVADSMSNLCACALFGETVSEVTAFSNCSYRPLLCPCVLSAVICSCDVEELHVVLSHSRAYEK